MGRLGLSMVRVSVCKATHPCRSRLEGRKSDHTLGGGRLGLGLEGSSQRLFPRQGHWYKPTYATKKLWYEIYIHKNSLLPVLSGEIYDSLLTAFFRYMPSTPFDKNNSWLNPNEKVESRYTNRLSPAINRSSYQKIKTSPGTPIVILPQ